MSKKVAAVLIVAALLLGSAAGAAGYWYFKVQAPRAKLMEMAKRQQEEMNKMVRSGEVVSVKPDEIDLKVERSGDPDVAAGTELKLKTDGMTTVQEGMNILSKPGQPLDLTKHLKPGTKVDVLVSGDKAVAVHWEAPGQAGQVAQGQR